MKINIHKESREFKPFDLTITFDNKSEVENFLNYIKEEEVLTIRQIHTLERKIK